MEKKLRISRVRDVHAYCEMWHASQSLLFQGRGDEEGSYYQFMGSLVFIAFSLEAYLNHIGPHLLESWPEVQRRSPKTKLSTLAKKLKIEIDFDTRPWQIVTVLFGFRNEIAHGKTVTIRDSVTVSLEDQNRHDREFVQTDWEKLCTQENAERARADVEQIVHILNLESGLGGHPFIGGWQQTESTLEEG